MAALGILLVGFGASPSAQTGDKFSQDYKSNSKDIEAVLAYQPRQPGVDYTKPTAEELKACTMKLIIGERPNSSGWLLLDPQGRPLRRFMDNTGKKWPDGRTHTDTWSYFKDGVEVYREVDSNAKDKPDQFRWFNTGGTRWGVDINGDLKIDTWRMISSEEVAQEAYFAVASRDFARLQALLISDDELRSLKLPDTENNRIRDTRGKAQARFQEICNKAAGLTSIAKFDRVESATPQCIPADTRKGPPQDVLRMQSRTIVYEDANKKVDFLQSGEMVLVGQAWRLVESPFVDIAPPETRKNDVPLQKIQQQIEQLDKTSMPKDWIPGQKSAAVVNYYATRAGLLEQQLPLLEDANKEIQLRQILDHLCTGHQASSGDNRLLDRLGQYKKQIAQTSPNSNLAGYAYYRELWARFASDLSNPDPAKFPQIQDAWNKELEKFVQAYPKAEDAPDALRQLAINCEFGGKAEQDKALKYYGLILTNFPDHPLAPHAKGAIARMGLNGRPLELTGPTLQGGQFAPAKFTGKVTVVYYWASSPKAPVVDFAVLKQLHSTYGAKGFEIVTVNLDESANDAKATLTSNPLPGTHLFLATNEAKGMESPLARQYGIIAIPTVFLVGKDGRVIDRSIQLNDLEEAIKKALN
jgi:tetratricopeptide (TPR) repeat protein